MYKRQVLNDDTKDAILNSIPLSRAGKPEDLSLIHILHFQRIQVLPYHAKNAENLFLREDFAMNVRKQCKMICQKCMVLKIKLKRVQQRILMEKCVSLKTD